MNRHEDELEKEIADKYIEKTVKTGTEEPSRSFPVLWQRQWCVC